MSLADRLDKLEHLAPAPPDAAQLERRRADMIAQLSARFELIGQRLRDTRSLPPRPVRDPVADRPNRSMPDADAAAGWTVEQLIALTRELLDRPGGPLDPKRPRWPGFPP